MLTPAEERLVAAHLASSDHDYFFNVGVSGEPFIRDGLLCYFDGTAVEVCGVPVDGVVDGELACRVQRVVDSWVCSGDVAWVSYAGPVVIDGPRSTTFEVHYSEDPSPGNLDVFIDLTRPSLTGKEVRKALRRADALGITTSVCRRDYLGPEHLRLVQCLVTREDFCLEDVSAISSVASILRHPATFVVEARLHDRLVGFCVGHSYFPTTTLAVCGAFDRGVPRASDAVYGALVQHSQHSGAARLALGYATDENLLRYKTKWGEPIVGLPIYQRLWGNGPGEYCVQWPWRLYQAAFLGYEKEEADL